MKYIPVHKKTRQRYPAITEEEKNNGGWSKMPYREHFRFEPVPEEKAPQPIEIKKAQIMPEKAKETDPLKG